MGQFSFATSNALPLVALLCLASVLFLVVCVAKYFRSRTEEVSSVADAVPLPHQVGTHPALGSLRLDTSRTEEVSSVPDAVPLPHQVGTHPALGSLRLDDAVEASIDKVMQTWGAPPAAATNQAYACNEEDQRETRPGETLPRVSEIADLRDALTARVASDRDSAHGLKELVRALYLDQSNFRFHDIAELQAEDRVLARALIEQWMTDPTAIEYWEQTYAAVCESPAALRADRA